MTTATKTHWQIRHERKERQKKFFPTLNKAWRKFKKLRIYTMRNWCCRGCSMTQADQDLEGDEHYLGYVHYNTQGVEGCRDTGKLCIYFAAKSGNLSVAVARIAKLHFEAHGFNVEWDGTGARPLTLTLKED